MGLDKKLHRAFLDGTEVASASTRVIVRNTLAKIGERFGKELAETICNIYNIEAAKESMENAIAAGDLKSASCLAECIRKLEKGENNCVDETYKKVSSLRDEFYGHEK